MCCFLTTCILILKNDFSSVYNTIIISLLFIEKKSNNNFIYYIKTESKQTMQLNIEFVLHIIY